MKRILAALLVVMMMAVPFTGVAEEKTTLTFWHGFSGNAAEVLQTIVDNFNASQDHIFVDAQFQGSYEESLNKLKASARTNAGPDMVQIYEGGTRFMVDSGFVVPMQELIEKYSIDISQLEENILSYYTVNDRLYSMPMNTSVPVCYYNKTVLSKVGYPDGPKSWDDIIKISQAVMEQNLATWGIALSTNMWWFELLLLQQGVDLVDQDNGRRRPCDPHRVCG